MAARSLYFVTGASRGLGESIARLALAEGHSVVGIARSPSPLSDKNYEHVALDLSRLESFDTARDLFLRLSLGLYKEVHLVNNAGKIEPVGNTGVFDERELIENYVVNLIAPVALTNHFLKAFSKNEAVKIITNVTSGVAREPKATWAPYSSAKAGLNAFSSALADEYAHDPKVKVLSYEPGIIDTEMQAEIRSIPKDRFPDLERFVDFKKSGALAPPEKVAKILMKILRSPTLGKEIFRSVSEG